MPASAKPKKMGRPNLPKGHAKGQIVPVRFTPEVIKRITLAAKANDQTVSEWIRNTVDTGLQA
jgi:predicted HicB family RNase H-like nuclease